MPCKMHPTSNGCRLATSEDEIDILDASGPCQPFSKMRNGGFSKQPEEHDEYGTTFAAMGSVLSVVRRVLPKVFVSEQVQGFGKTAKHGLGESPKSTFVREVLGIVGRDGRPHFENCIAVTLDSSDFVKSSRPRFTQ